MRADYKKWVGGEYLDQIRQISSSGITRGTHTQIGVIVDIVKDLVDHLHYIRVT